MICACDKDGDVQFGSNGGFTIPAHAGMDGGGDNRGQGRGHPNNGGGGEITFPAYGGDGDNGKLMLRNLGNGAMRLAKRGLEAVSEQVQKRQDKTFRYSERVGISSSKMGFKIGAGAVML